jgi:transcriptional regulator of acetoin/glycerol metabolism
MATDRQPRTAGFSLDLNAIEREMVLRALAECGGNKSRAAARLGISRTQLYVRLRKHKLIQAPPLD